MCARKNHSGMFRLALSSMMGLSLLCSNGVRAMGGATNGNGRSKGWLGSLGPSVNYDAMAQALEPVIIKAMEANGVVMTNALTESSKSMAETFAKGMTEAAEGVAGNGVDTLFTRLNANVQAGAQGDQFFENFFGGLFGSLKQNFDDGGAGKGTVESFFGTFAEQFNGAVASLSEKLDEGGEVDGLNKKALGLVDRMVKGLVSRDGILGNGIQEGISRVHEGADTGIEKFLGDAGAFAKGMKAMRERADEAFDGIDEEIDRVLGEEGTAAHALEKLNGRADDAVEGLDEKLQNLVSNTEKRVVQLLGGKEDQDIKAAINGMIDGLIWRNAYIGIVTTSVFLSTYYGTKLGWRMLERNWTRPKLIIASSKKSLPRRLIGLFSKKPKSPEMVFEKELELRLQDIVRATKNIQLRTSAGATNVKYRNLMLWGPPGTGKTMFAKSLAHESGLEWAYMSGSSFSKFKDGEGIEALDDLFKWANKSEGLMLFIDEAESFLSNRNDMDSTSKSYQLLNNFLNYTGERSNRFMIVFATNHKNNIDSAMHRRIDDLIEIPLPKVPERARVLSLYRDKILLDVKQNGKEFVDAAQIHLSEEILGHMAQQTEGLSHGDLEGIINTIKTDADITDSGLVTFGVVDQVVKRAVEKHMSFLKDSVAGRAQLAAAA